MSEPPDEQSSWGGNLLAREPSGQQNSWGVDLLVSEPVESCKELWVLGTVQNAKDQAAAGGRAAGRPLHAGWDS